MRGMGMGTGMLIGAIMGNRRKKNDGKYHQPGGILLYGSIPFIGFFISLNTYFNLSDFDRPPQPDIWLSPLLIILFTIGAVWFVAWIRKVDREEHAKQAELKRQQWLEHIRNPQPLVTRHK